MKTSKLLITSLLAAAAMSAVPAWAADVSGNRTWTSNSADILSGDNSVASGTTLTIDGDAMSKTAGSTVKLGDSLTIAGTLKLPTAPSSGDSRNAGTLIKANIATNIILLDGGKMSTNDGAMHFSKGVQVGNGTSTTASVTFEIGAWAKGNVISALTGSGTFNFTRNGSTQTGLLALDADWSSAGKTEADAFAGTINVSGTNRLALMADSAAKNSVVNLAASSSLSSSLHIGYATSGDAESNTVDSTRTTALNTTIAGLSGAGTVVSNIANSVVARDTLTLNVADGASYASSATIGTSAKTISIVKSGGGAQTLSGTKYLNDLSVTGGTLSLSGTTNIAGTTNVTAGTLDVSSATVTLASSIQNSGTVSVTSDTTFNLSVPALRSMKNADGTFSVISGGNVSGWDTLSTSDFTFNGEAFSEGSLGRYSGFAVGTDGKITFTESAANLVWTNAADGTWDTSAQNWTNTSTGEADAFVSYDSVEFNKSGTYTVTVDSEGVTADIVKISSGTVSFSGGTITALGGVSVTGGALSIGSASTFATSSGITLSGSTLAATASFTLANTVNVSAASMVSVASSMHTLTLSGAVTGTGTLTKTGAGTLALTNAGTSVNLAFAAGNLKVAGATVNIVSTNSAGDIAFAGSGGTVVFKGTDDSAGVSYAVGAISAGESPDNYARNVTVESGATVSAAAFTNGWGMGTVRVDGILNVSGTFSFATGSNGNQTTNVITGDGTIKVGTLNIGNVGTYTIDVNRLEIGSGGITISNNRETGKTTYLGKTTIVASESWSSVVSSNQKFTLNSSEGTTFEMQKSDGTATFASIFEGTGKLIKSGAGTLTLSGNNTFTGGTVIEAGTVVAAHENALGTTKGVEVQSGATLKLGTDAVTVAGLSGAGAVGLAAGTDRATLTVNGGGVFTGTLTNVSLVKQGADSTLELSNAGNWNSSATVEAGTLRIAPDTIDDSSYVSITRVSVSDGAKLEIAPNSSAAVSFGLYATGGVTFAAESKLVVDLTGAATDVALSIITSSAIKYNNGSEDVSLTSDSLNLFVNDFVTLEGWDGLANWAYDGLALSVTLTIPEPSAFGLLAGLGALALAGTRRRRKKA